MMDDRLAEWCGGLAGEGWQDAHAVHGRGFRQGFFENPGAGRE